LGSVQIKIGEAGSQVTTPDPPPPGGYTMTSVPDGKQTVVAERFGYDRYAKEINLSSESGYFDLKIDLDPWPGTPDVSRLASQNNYWNSGNAWPSNVPQNYQNLSQSWGYGSWNNSAINSSNYPNYYGQNTYSPASYNQNWQNPTNSSWQNYPSPYSYPYAQPYQQNYTSPYASQYGNYQLSDQTINLDRVTDFRVARNNSDGNYYILLNQNSFTPRQLFFVDNGSGAGGLVFFSALPQALSSGYNLNQSQDWYVSLYSKNQLSEPTFVNNTFSKVAFSPYEYARVISGQLTSNFNQRLELNSAN
jgi:hypothetical protein